MANELGWEEANTLKLSASRVKNITDKLVEKLKKQAKQSPGCPLLKTKFRKSRNKKRRR